MVVQSLNQRPIAGLGKRLSDLTKSLLKTAEKNRPLVDAALLSEIEEAYSSGDTAQLVRHHD